MEKVLCLGRFLGFSGKCPEWQGCDEGVYNVNMEKVLEELREFNKARDWDQFHSPENLAKSISIESGELLECFQWNNDFEKDDVEMELADVLSYCYMLADKLGVDPNEIVLKKLEITKKKYPVEKAKGTSKKYTEL